MLDARKNEVYAALYDNSALLPVPLINDSVMPPERFIDMILAQTGKPVIFAGDGAERYLEIINSRMNGRAMFAPFQHQFSRAANGIPLVLDSYRKGSILEPAQLLPLYLRKSEAEYAKMDKQKSI
jgi:tRNA threonylcarbamoyladenosine biosynthesis protein TsaB